MTGMSIFDEPKIDCHLHVLDPVRFPYGADTHYRPAGQETGTYEQLIPVLDAYGMRHALVVGPNSGYDLDNAACSTRSRAAQAASRASRSSAPTRHRRARGAEGAGVVGVAWNVTFYGVPYYAGARPLLAHLRELDMCVSLQTEHDQMVDAADAGCVRACAS